MVFCDYIYIFIDMYIYICIQICYIIVRRNLLISFGNKNFPRKLISYFENVICPFENMRVSKKVNYLHRKYDLFIQKYGFFKENIYLLRKY